MRKMHSQKIHDVLSITEVREAWRVVRLLFGCVDARIGNQEVLFETTRVLASIILELEIDDSEENA